MATLTTDFIKIAQVGPSIDGRYIREEWIRDMAETYDPATYTAMLWPEHFRWCGNFGEVLELRDGPDEKGVHALFARFSPNRWFLDHNASGQGLFYSIEVAENFAGTGKTYLAGLGVTDSPASLGQRSTHFSASSGAILIGNVPFQALPPAEPGTAGTFGRRAAAKAEEDAAPGWFTRLFPNLFTSDRGEISPETKDTLMDDLENRIAALEDGLSALKDIVSDIDGRVAALEVDVAASGDGDGASDDPAYKALARQLGTLRKEMGDFTRQIGAAVRAGTQAEKHTGAGRGKKVL